jgi:hypothetical protein
VRESETVQNGTGERVRVRAVLKRELRAWAGNVDGDPGERASVRACWSTAGRGEGGADRGVPRRSERESGRAGETARHADEVGSRGREGKGHADEGNWRRQSGLIGQRERGR